MRADGEAEEVEEEEKEEEMEEAVSGGEADGTRRCALVALAVAVAAAAANTFFSSAAVSVRALPSLALALALALPLPLPLPLPRPLPREVGVEGARTDAELRVGDSAGRVTPAAAEAVRAGGAAVPACMNAGSTIPPLAEGATLLVRAASRGAGDERDSARCGCGCGCEW